MAKAQQTSAEEVKKPSAREDQEGSAAAKASQTTMTSEAATNAGASGITLPSAETLTESRYFPTQIFAYKLDESEAHHLNVPLLEAIYAEREKDLKGIQRSNFQALGGWHSHTKLHKEREFAQVVSLVDACGAALSEKNTYDRNYRLTIGTMWSIVNPPGSANRAHIHPSCLWSGVYYVQAPENSGDIEFTDPRTENLIQPARFMPNRRPKACLSKVTFTPEAGKIFIFPSWLYHSVAPNLSTEEGRKGERVIISFNLNQTKVAKSTSQ